MGESDFLRLRLFRTLALINFTSQQETPYLWPCLDPFTSWLKATVASFVKTSPAEHLCLLKRHTGSSPERVRVKPDKVIDSQMVCVVHSLPAARALIL